MTTDTKLKEIIAEQEEIFVRRQPNSARLAARATEHLTGGCGRVSLSVIRK